MWGMAAIGLIYASFLAVGWLAHSTRRRPQAASGSLRASGIDDFMVASRAMPLWLATFTMTATWVDGGYLLGTAEGAYRTSIASGLQGGVCFGISLILGGLFFARRMRELEFHTLIDPFEARFGPKWAAVLAQPAVLAEMFWSAELLVALGSTFGVMLDMNLATAIVLSAVVVTLYTMAGGIWAVAYTDAYQLTLVFIGLAVTLPIALDAVGGASAAWSVYQAARPEGSLPVGWWDVSIMLMLGGIPWNCYFQRVLSCRSANHARMHSLLSGVLTIVLTIPPLLMGLVAFAYVWPPETKAVLDAHPAHALPLIFRDLMPPFLGLLGLAAIIGAVTSSFSSSILSAGSMFSWNVCWRLINPGIHPTTQSPRRGDPGMSLDGMKILMRVSIAALGVGAVWMALVVQSVQALWFFTSDLVFVLLFPQLTSALFDRKANLAGSVTAFVVSLILRVGAGEPLFAIPPLIAYPDWMPVRTFAAATGLILLPVVSRLTVKWSEPRPLTNVHHNPI